MVAEIIRSLGRDITVVLIEHDMDLALGTGRPRHLHVRGPRAGRRGA